MSRKKNIGFPVLNTLSKNYRKCKGWKVLNQVYHLSIKGKGNGNKGVSFQSKKVYNIRQLPEGEVKSGVYIYIYIETRSIEV